MSVQLTDSRSRVHLQLDSVQRRGRPGGVAALLPLFLTFSYTAPSPGALQSLHQMLPLTALELGAVSPRILKWLISRCLSGLGWLHTCSFSLLLLEWESKTKHSLELETQAFTTSSFQQWPRRTRKQNGPFLFCVHRGHQSIGIVRSRSNTCQSDCWNIQGREIGFIMREKWINQNSSPQLSVTKCNMSIGIWDTFDKNTTVLALVNLTCSNLT